MAAKRTTIRDIAAHSGMSITAVSLVLNNKPCKISEASRHKIFAAAKALNYAPNQMAVGLVTRRTRTLGLIVSDISNTFFSILTKGVEAACQEQGWSVVLCDTWDRHARDLALIDMLAGRGVEGIIYCMSADSHAEQARESYERFERYSLPFVEVDSDFTRGARHNVYFDNETGGYLAARHLVEHGHRRIACITGPGGADMAKGRMQGYRKALEEAGIPFDASLIAEGDYTMDSGASALRRLWGREFTAVFAFNDMMAIGALKAFRELGVSVPGEVSLVGYDDIPVSEMLEVPLTTVHQPVYEMGRAAAQNMIDLIEDGSDKDMNVCFAPTLVERRSVRDIKPQKEP